MLSQANLIIIGIFIMIIIYAIKRFSRKNHNQSQQQPKWSISKISDQPGALHQKIKQGYGIQSLWEQKPDTISYICLEQGSQTIIHAIQNWNFANLRRLFLGSNNLHSVQPFATMILPNLQVLDLKNNKIISFKSLRKLKTQSLIWIQIQGNPSYERLNSFTELNLNNLIYMWIQFFENEKAQSDDLSWLMKCDSFSLQKLHAKSENRLICKNFINTLKKKYTSLDFRCKP